MNPHNDLGAPLSADGENNPRSLLIGLTTNILKLVAMVTAGLYGLYFTVESILNAGNIVTLEVKTLRAIGSSFWNAVPTGPSGPNGPPGGPIEGGGAAGPATIIICIFAILFFIFAWQVWEKAIETHLALARACVARDIWSWLGCTLRWILVVIEIIVFIVFTFFAIFYVFINIIALIAVIGIALGATPAG